MTEIAVMKLLPEGVSPLWGLQAAFDILNCGSDTKVFVSDDGMLGYYGADGKLLRTATLREVYGDRAVQLPSGKWMLR